MDLRREKGPDDPVETLLVAAGRVEPVIGRGQLRVDFSGLVAIPGASEPPDSNAIAEVVWTPGEMYARSATVPKDPWELDLAQKGGAAVGTSDASRTKSWGS